MIARLAIFVLILAVGMPILWLFIRHGERHQRISFFGLAPTSRADNPAKFDRVLRSYKLQLFALPVVAGLVAAFMELPN